MGAAAGIASVTPIQIRRLRNSLGMSVREFADALGYSPRNGHLSVYRLENGDRQPSRQTTMLMKQLAAQCPKPAQPQAARARHT